MAEDDIATELAPMFEEDARLVVEARRLAGVFEEAAGAFAAEWMAERVRNAVTTEHEVTAALGDRLSDLKAGLVKLQEAAPRKAKAALKDLPWVWKQAWDEPRPRSGVPDHSPMHVYDGHSGQYGARLQCPRVVEDEIKTVVGDLGPLLKRYGYTAAENYKPATYQGKDYRYQGWVEVTREFLQALRTAGNADDKIIEHRESIAKRRRELKEKRAAAAWDDA